jgi:hypothetical protein
MMPTTLGVTTMAVRRRSMSDCGGLSCSATVLSSCALPTELACSVIGGGVGVVRRRERAVWRRRCAVRLRANLRWKFPALCAHELIRDRSISITVNARAPVNAPAAENASARRRHAADDAAQRNYFVARESRRR